MQLLMIRFVLPNFFLQRRHTFKIDRVDLAPITENEDIFKILHKWKKLEKLGN